jgi:hypothetical protein
LEGYVLQISDDDGDSLSWRPEIDTAVQCPYCRSEVVPQDADVWVSCASCGHRLNVSAQLAFARAETAFLSVRGDVGQAALRRTGRSSFRAKAPPDSLPLPTEITRAYQQAYGGLGIALRHELADAQRLAGYEMMAEITRQFAPRAMVSAIEAEYWVKLAVELTARLELDEIEAMPAGAGGLVRLRQRLRRRKLTKALAKLTVQNQELRRAIGFLDPLRNAEDSI